MGFLSDALDESRDQMMKIIASSIQTAINDTICCHTGTGMATQLATDGKDRNGRDLFLTNQTGDDIERTGKRYPAPLRFVRLERNTKKDS